MQIKYHHNWLLNVLLLGRLVHNHRARTDCLDGTHDRQNSRNTKKDVVHKKKKKKKKKITIPSRILLHDHVDHGCDTSQITESYVMFRRAKKSIEKQRNNTPQRQQREKKSINQQKSTSNNKN
jgi:hypothetical protein